MKIEIKPVITSEIKTLQNLCKTSFTETYANFNTEENMRQYFEKNFNIKQLYEELQNPASYFFFVISNDQPVGYVKLNEAPAQTDVNDDRSLEIERIYVLKTFHGRKAGKALFEKAKELALQKELEYIWLGVWTKNPSAIGFYEKCGFKKFGTHIFQVGGDEQSDWMMRYDL